MFRAGRPDLAPRQPEASEPEEICPVHFNVNKCVPPGAPRSGHDQDPGRPARRAYWPGRSSDIPVPGVSGSWQRPGIRGAAVAQ